MMLPISSVVYLKNGYEKLIIIQRIIDFNIDENLYYMEYAGALYPDGNEPFYFNEENIDKVVFKRYSDESNGIQNKIDSLGRWIDETGLILAESNRNLGPALQLK